jgi:hypothetical protein
LEAILPPLPKKMKPLASAVPAFHHVQPVMNLATECLVSQVTAEENGLHYPAELVQNLVGRMPDGDAGEAA